MLLVQDILDKYGEMLCLGLVAGKEGLKRKVKVPEVQRPGLSLSGHVLDSSCKSILIFGRAEMTFLKKLEKSVREERLRGVLNAQTPAVILARNYAPFKELVQLCEEKGIPLFRTHMKAMIVLSKVMVILSEELSSKTTCHGTLVEAFGVGILIQGDSSIGKSEAALGLIERGHRLVSDDIVHMKVREGTYLEGYGPELTRHLMEIRGIGIINVAHLYGAVCVRETKNIDLVVKLEEWDSKHFYDRVGLDEKNCEFLGINVPYHIVPLKPGRDVVLLLETIALNHRLKEMGYNSAKEFKAKLLATIAGRKTRGKRDEDRKEDKDKK